MLAEFENVYATGWRGSLFIVDDNFIGNKTKLKTEILPAICEWMGAHNYPFALSTEASIDLSDDAELMTLMARAGFNGVFVGIETPNEESLAECNKKQNQNRDMIACVKKIQSFGIEVRGGFIVGFDNDTPSVFDQQIEMIQNSRIVTAMVGLLNAPRAVGSTTELPEKDVYSTIFPATTLTFPQICNPKWAWRHCPRVIAA